MQLRSSTMAAVVVNCFLAFLSASALLKSVSGQNPSGFISLDCGLPANASYIEPNTRINYESDAAFIDTGKIHNISSVFINSKLKQQLWSLRSFPEGTRNCYKVGVKAGTKYLIRASFLYGDYDGQKKLPGFDLHFGPNFWTSVVLDAIETTVHLEIIHIVSSSSVQVCLVDTGSGTPFISALELRPLRNSVYETRSASLATFLRLDAGSVQNITYRYKDDVYDRVWVPMIQLPSWTTISTNDSVDVYDTLFFQPAPPVMNSAATPKNASASSMEFNWLPPDDTTEFFVYLYFAEIQKLQANESRVFDITLNGKPWARESISPKYLLETVSYLESPVTGGTYDFSFTRTANSTLPPLLNAIEVYRVIKFPQSETNEQDVEAISKIKAEYGVARNWQGDPCAPTELIWQGVNCSFMDSVPPRITSLDLSSSGLTGEITRDIANLELLETLDLSNNNLTGTVPDFLTQLSSLRVLNLEGNNLSGPIPSQLIEKSNDGSLFTSFGDNPNLLIVAPSGKKKSNVAVPVAASVSGFVMLLFLILGAIFWIKTKQRKQGAVIGKTKQNVNQYQQWRALKKCYSYSEILRITNNFERLLGEGGFGRVYYGQIDGVEVAVKMLSPRSAQGYHQFQAEVDTLVRVHHRNLTALVGYCDDSTNKGLVYEYMGRGDLGSLISGGGSKVLNWEERLYIAVDAAHGLEYLHYGIKPAIIHRDIKSSNILLDNDFRAKVADFGLSRIFPTEGGATHVTASNVVGTYGYIDPEYHTSFRLTEKSDVFAFGVILLEIVTGKSALTRTQGKVTHVSQWVEPLVSRGDIRSIIDPKMGEDFDVNSIWKVVDIGLVCASFESGKRPTMSQVVVELKECLAMELARHKQTPPETHVADSSALFGPSPR